MIIFEAIMNTFSKILNTIINLGLSLLGIYVVVFAVCKFMVTFHWTVLIMCLVLIFILICKAYIEEYKKAKDSRK